MWMTENALGRLNFDVSQFDIDAIVINNKSVCSGLRAMLEQTVRNVTEPYSATWLCCSLWLLVKAFIAANYETCCIQLMWKDTVRKEPAVKIEMRSNSLQLAFKSPLRNLRAKIGRHFAAKTESVDRNMFKRRTLDLVHIDYFENVNSPNEFIPALMIGQVLRRVQGTCGNVAKRAPRTLRGRFAAQRAGALRQRQRRLSWRLRRTLPLRRAARRPRRGERL